MGLFATWRHIKRLADVEERLRALETAYKSLDMEWSDTSDHLRKMLGKIAKRANALEALTDGAKNSGTDVIAGSAQMGAPSGLTVAQIQAQRELERRRGTAR